MEGQIKSFSDEEKLKKHTPTQPALPRTPEGLLRAPREQSDVKRHVTGARGVLRLEGRGAWDTRLTRTL